MHQKHYFKALTAMLAQEYCCTPEDFQRSENILTPTVLVTKGRIYNQKRHFFHMATTGGNAVISASPKLHPFLHQWVQCQPGHALFQIPHLIPLEQELQKHGYHLTETYHMFLPTSQALDIPPRQDCSAVWLTQEELLPFYGSPSFPNAICPECTPNRPDVLAVCAYHGTQLMGMAGCSEDMAGWLQIGIDVLPEYRSKGLGTYLVTLLRNRILQDLHAIPFYGTSIANYHSWNIAIRSGFRPAWLEICAERPNS
ncbi:GNAT family N-acetyltransferase [uncultured Ruminococcus sp.]|uniref:GNAT family N-acetyltransferase n=1 Tax=uncultured Ruminococcus sp. TaxID=165186 RepID=UPI00266B47C1|nr:GNAT family N-acetyltransferase [uncultured Ruminococcus sp.]